MLALPTVLVHLATARVSLRPVARAALAAGDSSSGSDSSGSDTGSSSGSDSSSSSSTGSDGSSSSGDSSSSSATASSSGGGTTGAASTASSSAAASSSGATATGSTGATTGTIDNGGDQGQESEDNTGEVPDRCNSGNDCPDLFACVDHKCKPNATTPASSGGCETGDGLALLALLGAALPVLRRRSSR